MILPDPVFNESMVTKFVNHLMYDGKKSTAFDIFYSSLETVKNKLPNEEKSPLEVWKKALENITPLVEVKSRRVGGANYQVPVEVRADRKTTLGIRWLVNYSRLRGERTMYERVAGEIMDASNGTGAAVKKREDTHKMAEANKAFAHYRF